MIALVVIGKLCNQLWCDMSKGLRQRLRYKKRLKTIQVCSFPRMRSYQYLQDWSIPAETAKPWQVTALLASARAAVWSWCFKAARILKLTLLSLAKRTELFRAKKHICNLEPTQAFASQLLNSFLLSPFAVFPRHDPSAVFSPRHF